MAGREAMPRTGGPSNTQGPNLGLVLRGASQETQGPWVSMAFTQPPNLYFQAKEPSLTQKAPPQPSPLHPNQPQEKASSCALGPGLLLLLCVAWFLVISPAS